MFVDMPAQRLHLAGKHTFIQRSARSDHTKTKYNKTMNISGSYEKLPYIESPWYFICRLVVVAGREYFRWSMRENG